MACEGATTQRPIAVAAAWGYRVDTESGMAHETTSETSAAHELIERRVRVAAKDVVFVKGICEASEGLCAMFAESGGDLRLAAPVSRARELDELVCDLRLELDAVVD
ncbi:MAG TPA: hypothetical protein VNN72_01185 [Polyangiaceae bacterium]|nr:hypothetical protein [Polyangiaceae bacterium]